MKETGKTTGHGPPVQWLRGAWELVDNPEGGHRLVAASVVRDYALLVMHLRAEGCVAPSFEEWLAQPNTPTAGWRGPVAWN